MTTAGFRVEVDPTDHREASVTGHTHTVYEGTPHTHTISDHTHTVADHTHGVTLSDHTHTVANHTHTVADHTHTVTVAAHTHTVAAHTHALVFGIYEETNTPTVYFRVDGGLPSANYTDDFVDVDITSQVTTAGSKSIVFYVDALCTISAVVEVKVNITTQ
jgi:hypothetical protein